MALRGIADRGRDPALRRGRAPVGVGDGGAVAGAAAVAGGGAHARSVRAARDRRRLRRGTRDRGGRRSPAATTRRRARRAGVRRHPRRRAGLGGAVPPLRRRARCRAAAASHDRHPRAQPRRAARAIARTTRATSISIATSRRAIGSASTPNGYDPGPTPQSEPEVAALVALIDRWQPRALVAVHQPFRCVNWDGGGAGARRPDGGGVRLSVGGDGRLSDAGLVRLALRRRRGALRRHASSCRARFPTRIGPAACSRCDAVQSSRRQSDMTILGGELGDLCELHVVKRLGQIVERRLRVAVGYADARGALVGGDSSPACAREAATVCAGADTPLPITFDCAACKHKTLASPVARRWACCSVASSRSRRRATTACSPSCSSCRPRRWSPSPSTASDASGAGRRSMARRRSCRATRTPTSSASSRAMQELYRLLDKVIESDSTVLIHGENGTGKELIARAIHYNWPRARRALRGAELLARSTTTCSTRELFGHKKGAFTGAHRRQAGPVRGRRRRHLLPRRDRRHVAGAAGQAAARAAGGHLHARRRHRRRAASTCASSPPPTAT